MRTSSNKAKQLSSYERMQQLQTEMMAQVKNYAADPQQYLELINFMDNFHNYSAHNRLLIYQQRPGAEAVASFKKFKDLGYSVLKGEKGIKILVPAKTTLFKREEADQLVPLSHATPAEKQQIKDGSIATKTVTHFRLGTVFDVLQTNMPPEKYPELYPNRHENFTINNSNEAQKIDQGLERVAEKLGVKINKKLTNEQFSNSKNLGNAKGAFIPDLNTVVLNPKNTPTENTTTLIHELAHAAMHNNKSEMKDLERPIKELQAELTAYSVAKTFGINTSKKATNYIASWTNNGKKLAELSGEQQVKILEKVSETSQKFVEIIDPRQREQPEKEHSQQSNEEKKPEITPAQRRANYLRARARAQGLER
ncbi:ArdC-like ssDNA-binding domain-containing protein [Bombilactobacillus bombi]|uniref:ArdC-like ssDNA-binding domain-containing protein n=1 Tax=Bombilactobacillus bombi TaxID=1303590 RepID=UPI0035EEE7F5